MEHAFFLRRGDLLALRGGGTRLTVRGGDAWITQHGDINDYLVREENWEAKSDGLVLVHALHSCLVDVTGPAGAKGQLLRREAPERKMAVAQVALILRRLLAFA